MKNTWMVILVMATAVMVAVAPLATYQTAPFTYGATEIMGEAPAVESTEAPAREGITSSIEGPVGQYYVHIKDARMGKTGAGGDCIIVTFEWSHEKEESQNFLLSFMYDAYQDGTLLEETYDSPDLGEDTILEDIQAGEILETEVVYVLRDAESSVRIEVTEFLGDNDDMVLRTFELPL